MNISGTSDDIVLRPSDFFREGRINRDKERSTICLFHTVRLKSILIYCPSLGYPLETNQETFSQIKEGHGGRVRIRSAAGAAMYRSYRVCALGHPMP